MEIAHLFLNYSHLLYTLIKDQVFPLCHLNKLGNFSRYIKLAFLLLSDPKTKIYG